MNFYGIDIQNQEILDFEYDKYYKEISLKLKKIKNDEELYQERIKLQQKFSKTLAVKINFEQANENFINIINDENSAQLLWILYSKYEGAKNYIDKISSILEKENKVYRAGTNLYKLNGWMTHSLYTYQISNYNIAKNIPLSNFNGEKRVTGYVKELHVIYENLSETGKFILKIISLVHDIGVIESIQYHDKIGYKYVNQVLNEIGMTDKKLESFEITFNELEIIISEIIKYHTIMSLLSGENSDKCVETYFKQMLNSIPEIKVKNEIPKIMYIFTFGDIIAVNESLMDEEKFQRLKNAYKFLNEIIENKEHTRNKYTVAIERICDMCGKKYLEVSSEIDNILVKYKIDKTQFFDDIYNIKWLHYTGPLMKTVNDLEISIHVFYEIFDLLKSIEGIESLKEYIITFQPSRPSIEYEFIEVFKNNNFFECLKKAKSSKENIVIYKNVELQRKIDELGKRLNISVLKE